MAYKEGLLCNNCGREIQKFECSVCDGTGKPQNAQWAAVRNTCPRCGGAGHVFNCPVGRWISLGEHFDGITCANEKYKDCNNLKDMCVKRQK